MKQILVLTYFQWIVSDFFTTAGKNFDTVENHFLVKRHLLGVIQILFIENSVSAAKNWNQTSIFLQKFRQANETNTCFNSFPMYKERFLYKGSKNIDSGTNYFLVKTPFTWCHTDSFDIQLSDRH